MKTETSHILCYTVLCACFLVLSCKRINDDSSEYRNSFIGEIGRWDSMKHHESKHDTSLVTLPNGMILRKIDSLYHWDDMVFNEESLNVLCPSDNRAAVMDNTNYYWPYGIIPYKFNYNIISDTTYIHEAMAHIERHTAIHFRPKRNSDSRYVEFKRSNVNQSPYGMQQSGQLIELYDTHIVNTIIHEILHSMGFFHEHCRSDRDLYININYSNIKDSEEYNFQKYTEDGFTGMDLGPFDYESVMIYESQITDPDFVYDPTILTMTKKSDGSAFGPSDSLTVNDIKGIKSIYGPPFHRLESHRLRVVEDDVWGFIETFITEHADSIIFYSDASCTTREPLPFKRRIKVLRTECTDNNLNYHYDYSYLTVTVPAGTTAYCLWQGFNYECYYCSDPYNYHITTHEIVNKQLNSISYIHQ